MKRLVLLLLLAAGVASAPGIVRAADEDHYPTAAELNAPARPTSADAATADTALVYSQIPIHANKLGMTITNYGFIGTNFTTRASSFEYPLGSQFQHLIRAGLWIGGGSYDELGAFTGVSTSAMDGTAGQSPYQGDEYTPGRGDGGKINRRSSLPEDAFASASAVSEADFITRFSDMPSNPKTGNIEGHRSLHVTVTQYNYAWSFSDYQHMLFFHYVIRNDGPTLNDAWVGLYSELASGDMKQQTGQSLYQNWFKKKQIAYVDSLRLFTERYCLNKPIPGNCHYDLVPELVGIKLLGAKTSIPNDTTTRKITMAAWTYDKTSPIRDEDVEKYAILSAGTIYKLDSLQLSVFDGDPVELLAIGPFPSIVSGDSVSVDFAMLAATDALGAVGSTPVGDLLAKRAAIAQRAYDLNYIVPVPPPSPRMTVVPADHAIDIYFNNSPESFEDPTNPDPINKKDFKGYRIYAGEDRENLHLLAQFDLNTPPVDTTGFNTGMGAITLDHNPSDGVDSTYVDANGTRYQYRYHLDHLRDGFKYWAAVTSYDVGTSQIESLESGVSQNEAMFVPGPTAAEVGGLGVTVFPNPYRVEAAWDQGQTARQHYLWFANMPPQSRLKIYTLSGALIYEADFNGSTYDGRNARGVYAPGSDLKPHLSGTMFGWDLITRQGQATATGLYLWAVEDTRSGKRQTGKFLLVKSDRENF